MRTPTVTANKDFPDHHDAELVLRCYEMRREPTMREARNAITSNSFLPKNATELIAVSKADHPLNTAWRQVTTYWEMVYAMAKHGVMHPDFLMESSAEGMLVLAKVEPFLAEFRSTVNPRALLNAEWVANNSDLGRELLDRFRRRFEGMRQG